MAAGSGGLLVAVDSPVHRLPAQPKIVALALVVVAIVLTPAGSWGVLAGQGLLVVGAARASRLPAGLVARRLLVEAPFVVFALLMPLVAQGPRIDVGPLSLSRAGLVGGATLLVKATLGVLAAIVLAATTPPRDLLAGLERLRLPAALVAILTFMARYLAVTGDELRRLRMARQARGGAGGARGLVAVAGGVGVLFVRTFERGERVQHAMLARGYDGRMPMLAGATARPVQWALALALPAAAALVLVLGVLR